MPPLRTATPLLLLAVLATVYAHESHLVSHALRSRRTGWAPKIHRQLSNNVEQTTLSTRHRRRLLNLSPPEQTVAALAILLAASLATGTAPSMLSGVVAAGFIAPLAYAFDSATAQNASGKRRLEQALAHLATQFVTDISKFCGPEFFLSLLTMVGTFGFVNLLAACGVDGAAKLIPLTLVASGLSIHKDTSLTKASGLQPPSASFPLISQALFLCRDLINILAVFLLPPTLARRLQTRLGPSAAAAVAQFLCPFFAQIAQTWVHVLGLSYYNSPDAPPLHRARAVARQFGKAYAARAGRTAVVYSAGGTLNRALLQWSNSVVQG